MRTTYLGGKEAVEIKKLPTRYLGKGDGKAGSKPYVRHDIFGRGTGKFLLNNLEDLQKVIAKIQSEVNHRTMRIPHIVKDSSRRSQ